MNQQADRSRSAPPGHTPATPRVPATRVTRRGFLRGGMYGTVGLFTAQALVGAGVMVWPAKVSGFGGTVVVPKPLSEMKPGDPPLKVREGKFYISRLPEGIMALYWKCTHLGCTVPWVESEDLFHCPCHGSLFQRTGQNVGGPAPRPLDLMAVEIQGDQIVVNTGKITQRERHQPEHVTRI